LHYIKNDTNENFSLELPTFVNDESEDGLTLLMAACVNYNYDLIEMLTNDFNADIGAANKDGNTAISLMILNILNKKWAKMNELEPGLIKSESQYSEIYDVCIFIFLKM